MLSDSSELRRINNFVKTFRFLEQVFSHRHHHQYLHYVNSTIPPSQPPPSPAPLTGPSHRHLSPAPLTGPSHRPLSPAPLTGPSHRPLSPAPLSAAVLRVLHVPGFVSTHLHILPHTSDPSSVFRGITEPENHQRPKIRFAPILTVRHLLLVSDVH